MSRLPRTTEDDLVDIALAARTTAYAPYSKFHVGAAVLTDDGRMFGGCNVENASYPLGVCAERNAVAAAVVSGMKSVRAVAIVTTTSPPSPPCGACRQVLAEFARGDLQVVLANTKGERKRSTIAKLLPSTFTKAFLK